MREAAEMYPEPHPEDLEAYLANEEQAHNEMAELLGPAVDQGERWTRYEGTNGVARFLVLRHASGQTEFFLQTTRPMLIYKAATAIPALRCLIAIGFRPFDKRAGNGD